VPIVVEGDIYAIIIASLFYKNGYGQLITIILSIYKNFSLGFLCKALHKRPDEKF